MGTSMSVIQCYVTKYIIAATESLIITVAFTRSANHRFRSYTLSFIKQSHDHIKLVIKYDSQLGFKILKINSSRFNISYCQQINEMSQSDNFSACLFSVVLNPEPTCLY